jgi:hypothetical protein
MEIDGVRRGLLRLSEGSEEENRSESEGFHEWSVSRSAWERVVKFWRMGVASMAKGTLPPSLRGILQGSCFVPWVYGELVSLKYRK